MRGGGYVKIFPTLVSKKNSEIFQLFGGRGGGLPKSWKIPIFFLYN